MEKFDLEKFPTSESAQRMLSYVSDGFYDTSYIGKWLFQVMGTEYDEARRVIEELPKQLFPETATWGLMYHEIKWGLPVRENLSDEERRRLIYEKRDYKAPMTPYRMEQYLANVTGFDVHVTDIHDSWNGYLPEHPNQFRVFFVGEGMLNAKAALSAIRRIKQSHTTFEASEYIGFTFGVDIFYNAQLRMVSTFYPRYNTPPFLLDGRAQLDGTYYLNGYLSGETLDFYPVVLRVIMGADWRTERAGTAVTSLLFRPEIPIEIKNDIALGIWGAAYAKTQTISRFFLQSSASAGTRTSSQLTMQGAVEERVDEEASVQIIGETEVEIVQESALQVEGFIDCEVKTDGILTVEKDLWLLDGSVMLDGSRILDAEIYTEEI